MLGKPSQVVRIYNIDTIELATDSYCDFAGKRLLVVGGGQSAAEVLAHLLATNVVAWHHRSEVRYYNVPLQLPEPLFKLIAQSPGILHHLPAIVAVTAPCPASYYRLRPGRWAPTGVDLGVQDRGSAVRICPVFATEPAAVARQFNLEFRVADAAASPYLALGVLVRAGLDGLRHRRTLAELQPAALPASLSAALALFADSVVPLGFWKSATR